MAQKSKIELTKQDMDYEDKINIGNKLYRKTFSFAYALQIFKAQGLKNIRLED